jgi:hypothetical protein
MNHAEYQRATQLLVERGIHVQSLEYSERSFGSWYLVASTQPPRRLVWDGKEKWLVVEEETEERFNGLPVWRELWLERNTKPQSIELAVTVLCTE